MNKIRSIVAILAFVITGATTAFAQRAELWTSTDLAKVCLKGGNKRCTSIFVSGDTWFPFNGSDDAGMWYHSGVETPTLMSYFPMPGTTFEWMVINDDLYLKPIGWIYSPEWPVVVPLHRFDLNYAVLALKVLRPDAYITTLRYDALSGQWVEDLRAEYGEVIIFRDGTNFEGRRGVMYLGEKNVGMFSGIQFAPSELSLQGWRNFWTN